MCLWNNIMISIACLTIEFLARESGYGARWIFFQSLQSGFRCSWLFWSVGVHQSKLSVASSVSVPDTFRSPHHIAGSFDLLTLTGDCSDRAIETQWITQSPEALVVIGSSRLKLLANTSKAPVLFSLTWYFQVTQHKELFFVIVFVKISYTSYCI